MSGGEHEPEGRRTFTRRQILGLAAGGAVVVGGGAVGIVRLTGEPQITPDELRLIALGRVGRAYLDRLPEAEATEEALRRHLPEDWGTRDADEPFASLRTIADQVAAELAAYEVVDVAGWQLAVTEARAAGLIALTS
jgi:hypothetical protein